MPGRAGRETQRMLTTSVAGPAEVWSCQPVRFLSAQARGPAGQLRRGPRRFLSTQLPSPQQALACKPAILPMALEPPCTSEVDPTCWQARSLALAEILLGWPGSGRVALGA